MRISSYLNIDYVTLTLDSTTKSGVLQELVLLVKKRYLLKNHQTFLADVRKRESVISTGLQYGVALPHAASNGVRRFFLAFGRSPQGIDFDSQDGQKSNFFFLFGIPAADSMVEANRHWQRTIPLIKCLHNEVFCHELGGIEKKWDVISHLKRWEEKHLTY